MFCRNCTQNYITASPAQFTAKSSVTEVANKDEFALHQQELFSKIVNKTRTNASKHFVKSLMIAG